MRGNDSLQGFSGPLSQKSDENNMHIAYFSIQNPAHA